MNTEIWKKLRDVVRDYPGCETDLNRLVVVLELVPWAEGLPADRWILAMRASQLLQQWEMEGIERLMREAKLLPTAWD